MFYIKGLKKRGGCTSPVHHILLPAG